MNRWGVAAVVAALALGTPALAQSGSQTGQGSTGPSGTTAGSSTGAGSTASRSASAGKLDKDLTESIQKLHAANQAEIQMGQMGEQMAASQEVKDYAKKLGEDHQKNDQKLTKLAESLGVDLNGKAFQDEQKSAQKEMDKLHGKSGADFDKRFMSMMVKDHKKDVKEVQKATEDARKKNQPELASYLAATHTGLEGHLQSAQRIEKDLKSGKSASSETSPGSMGTGSSSSESMGTGSSSSGTGSSGSRGTGSSQNPNPSGGAAGPGGGSGGDLNR